jgi:hypothetical protein
MKYTIVACIHKYGVEDIRPFIESINRSKFSGTKVMVAYSGTPQETIQFLVDNGWEVFSSELHQHVILQRFNDVSVLLDNVEGDVIIWTDVKDVIFQNNPEEWLDQHFEGPILATGEGITFKDDPWAVVNAGTSFPIEWSWLQNEPTYCAGVIVGRKNYIRDLFKEIYRWSLTTSNPEQLSDQAAYNVLINLSHFDGDVQFVKQEEGFCIHMGVTWVKRNEFAGKLLSNPPEINSSGEVINEDGDLFYIVHQYERDPLLREKVIGRYKNVS